MIFDLPRTQTGRRLCLYAKAPPGKHFAGGAKYEKRKVEARFDQTAWFTIFDSLDILRAAVFL